MLLTEMLVVLLGQRRILAVLLLLLLHLHMLLLHLLLLLCVATEYRLGGSGGMSGRDKRRRIGSDRVVAARAVGEAAKFASSSAVETKSLAATLHTAHEAILVVDLERGMARQRGKGKRGEKEKERS